MAVSNAVVQLLVRLESVDPPVWRRLLVPGTATLGSLHRVLQAAMGWQDIHLHQFVVDGQTFMAIDDDSDDDELDETEVTVIAVLSDRGQASYDYDFGDEWQHSLVLEGITTTPWPLKFPVCLGGERACPPEDSGGPHRYQEFLEHGLDEEFARGIYPAGPDGLPFDPERFDVARTNVALQRIR